VMGILNITPDSFSDGGQSQDLSSALKNAEQMLNEGAAIIDVGGESTRPGADTVGIQKELERVIPVIERLKGSLDCIISIDTNKPAVMREAVSAGAGLINDVCALTRGDALTVAASLDVPVCLMHMQGKPQTMQQAPHYDNVCVEVAGFLAGRVKACLDAGINHSQLIIDPGFGFGKTLDDNLSLMRHLDDLNVQNLPVLVGVSRKSMIGQVLDRAVDERLYGGLALAALAVWQGAKIIRTHDVRSNVDAINMIARVQQCQ